MAKWHISAKTGNAGVCKATKGACPFGGEENHFESEQEAFDAIMDRDPELKKLKKDIFITHASAKRIHHYSPDKPYDKRPLRAKLLKELDLFIPRGQRKLSERVTSLMHRINERHRVKLLAKNKKLRLKLQEELGKRGFDYNPVYEHLNSAEYGTDLLLPPVYGAKARAARDKMIRAGWPDRVKAYRANAQREWDAVPMDRQGQKQLAAEQSA